MTKDDAFIIEMNIAHYQDQAMLELDIDNEKRSTVERLLAEAEAVVVKRKRAAQGREEIGNTGCRQPGEFWAEKPRRPGNYEAGSEVRMEDEGKLGELATKGEEQKLRRDLDRCRFILHNISNQRACRLILEDMLEETEARLSLFNSENSASMGNVRWPWIASDGRSLAEPGVQVQFASWQFDPASRELVSSAGDAVALTTAEFELLVAFITNPRRVMSRDRLLDLSRHREASPFDRTIDVQVGRLRRKIEDDPKNPALIKTVRGGGYIFTAPVKSSVSRGPDPSFDI